MKYMKKVLLSVMLLAAVLLLTGCKLTPEKAVEKMNTALTQSQPTKAKLEMKAVFAVEGYGAPFTMTLDAEAHALFSAEPFSFYADVIMEMGNSRNAQETYTLELYGLMEDEQPVFYAYNVAGDTWSKSPAESGGALPPTSGMTVFPDGSLVELTESVTLPDGTVAHCLTYTVDGSMAEGMEEAFAALGDAVDVSKLDMSALRMPMNVYLDPETFLPVQMDVSLEGFDTLVQSVVDALLISSEGDLGFELTVDELSFAVTELEYGEQRIPQLPEEAPLYIEILSHEADQGDGTYVLRSPYDAVKVTCPDGWYVESYDYYYVTLYRNDNYRAIAFFVQEKSSAKDTGLYTVNYTIDELKTFDLYHSDGRGEKAGDYDLAWIRRTDGIFDAYGWQHLSDHSLLLVDVVDATGTYDAKVLVSEATAMVARHEP